MDHRTDTPLRALLQRGLRFAPSYGAALSNHLPMALIALARLGAPPSRLEAFFDKYAKRLEPADQPAPEVDVNTTVAELADGIGAAAFHGLIRTAYGLDEGYAPEVYAGLAAWRADHLPVGRTTRLFTDIDVPIPDAPNIHHRMAALAAHPRFIDALDVSAALEDATLIDFVIHAYASTDGNFTALHTVTALHAFFVVDAVAPLDRGALGAALTAAVLTVPKPSRVVPLPVVHRPWAELCTAAVASPDDHTIKLTHSCRELFDRSGDARFGAVAQHRLEAQRALPPST